MNKSLPERSDLEQLKKQAKDLLNEVRAGQSEAVTRIGKEDTATFVLNDAQRILAREYGFASWAKFKLHVESSQMPPQHMKPAIPILRIFEESKAKEHYIDFLNFKLDWEHRFGPNFPLYMQVSRGSCILHLSEHHGDASPGSALRIETADLDDFCAGLQAKDYKYSKPGLPEDKPWGSRELDIRDPFGNRLVFYEATKKP